MTRDRFSRMIRRWVYRIGRPEVRETARHKNFVRLSMDECESRIAPALMAPIVAEERSLAGNDTTPDNKHNGVQAAQDPVNPYRMVYVSSRNTGILAQYSQDGGVTWQ